MNAIKKSLVTVSALAAFGAGAANATTVATFDVFQYVDSVMYMGMDIVNEPMMGGPVPTANRSGTGTGVLDSSGAVTLDSNLHLITLFGTDSFTEALYGMPALPTSAATATLLSCTNGPFDGTNNTCSAAPVLQTGGVASATGALGNGTVIHLSFGDSLASTDYSFTISNYQTAAAVPVPAAAWLFGSGVLGLAGAARRRRSATAA